MVVCRRFSRQFTSIAAWKTKSCPNILNKLFRNSCTDWEPAQSPWLVGYAHFDVTAAMTTMHKWKGPIQPTGET